MPAVGAPMVSRKTGPHPAPAPEKLGAAQTSSWPAAPATALQFAAKVSLVTPLAQTLAGAAGSSVVAPAVRPFVEYTVPAYDQHL